MTPAEIDAARKLAEGARARADAATPGPWFRDVYEDGDAGEGHTGVYPGARGEMVESNDVVGPPIGEDGFTNDVATCFNAGDAAFVAAVRTDVPALADAITAALDALAEMTERAQKAEARLAAYERVDRAFDALLTASATGGDRQSAARELHAAEEALLRMTAKVAP